MRVGANAPYTDQPWGVEAWRALDALQPAELRICSFVDRDDLAHALATYPIEIVHVRPRTGNRNTGEWPENILDYRSWDTEQSLRECLDLLLERDVTPWLEMGNEPDIELAREPVDDPRAMAAAAAHYVAWFQREVREIRSAYGDRVKIAPAALSQGAPARFNYWLRNMLDRCMPEADFLVEHCYTNGLRSDNPDWGGRYLWLAERFHGKPLDLTEVNDNGAGARFAPEDRAAHIGDYLADVLHSGQVRSASLFTVPGSPQDGEQPSWWFLDREILHAVATHVPDQGGALPDAPESLSEAPYATSGDGLDVSPPEVAEAAPEPVEIARGHHRAYSEREMITISNAAADAYGIPRELLLACAYAESGLRADARRPESPSQDEVYWPDVSGGAWQQTVRYDPDYHGDDEYPGDDEVDRVLALQMDPERSARVAAANLADKWQKYQPSILKSLAAYNWPSGQGKAWSDPIKANYERGMAMASRALADMGGTGVTSAPAPAAIPPELPSGPPTYDPNQPAELQRQDWTCSVRTAAWVLKALGYRANDPALAGELQDYMQEQGFVNPEVGLTDARGYGLTFTLQQFMPDAWVERVALFVNEAVTWDWLRENAGRGPIALGGRGWNHWTAVRDTAHDGGVILANPAPGWKGVTNHLSREQFDRLGPWSAVRALVAEPVTEYVATTLSTDETVALRDEIQHLKDRLSGLETLVAHAVDVGLLADEPTRRKLAVQWAREFLGRKPSWNG